MINFVNFPPAGPDDVEFTPETLHQIGDRQGEKNELKKIGKNVGRVLIANVRDKDIGDAMGILYGMLQSEVNPVPIGGWEDLEFIMEGALRGMLHEKETELGGIRPRG